ncbi:MAG: amino acid adenylation domain-containing protein [Verrucomicrobiales bacterium]|nr:amino acid adenylation domain-containing protein [Verrucomicrobiales bacterium]
MSQLIQDYTTLQATQRPDATAIVAGDESLTYRQLETRSNQLANLLREAGCRPGDRVCLFLDKSPAAIIAMHGVLKADAVYVPVDVTSPAPRLAAIVKSCRPAVILAEKAAGKLLKPVLAEANLDSSPRIGTLDAELDFQTDFDAAELEKASEELPESTNGPEDIAHILFTSGSTGTPKGVMLSHRNVCHFVDWGREYFGIGPDDRTSGHSPFHFDLSTFDIYGSLSAGAQLHLVPAMANLLPKNLAQFIRESELTQWFSVPSALNLMARSEVIRENDFPSLERLLWCGEVLPTPTLIHLMERLPHVEFTNLYGPTETTIASSYFTMEKVPADPRDPVPIGRACDGEELCILDSDLQPVPDGEKGDLYISGDGLSKGYWEDPEKTREVFLDREDQLVYRTGDIAYVGEDGMFYFVGRNDSQIKSRGYRIELGEIEAAFNSLEIIKECAVVGVPSSGFEGTAICCAYVPQNGDDVSPEALRKGASELLPRYMLPKQWQQYRKLPKTGNGKSNRREIRETFESRMTTENN